MRIIASLFIALSVLAGAPAAWAQWTPSGPSSGGGGGSANISGLVAGQLGIAGSSTSLTSSVPFGQSGNSTIVQTGTNGLISTAILPTIPLANLPTIPFSSLASLTANQVLGALAAGPPTGITMPSSCNGSNQAVTWSSTGGPGCATITGGAATSIGVGTTAITAGTNGGLFYSNAAVLGQVGLGTTTTVLHGNASGTAPMFSAVNLATDVTGLLPNTNLANSTFNVSVPSFLTSSGQTSLGGTLAITAATGQTANQFLATPNGAAGALSVRAIVAADLAGLSPSFANLTVSGSPTFTGIAGAGTFCLQINASGLLSNTGAACGNGGSAAFSALTSGTNITAAMVVGTGASLSASGGTITATGMPATGLTGLVALANGGTGANLSGTGGTSQVLQQTGAGAAITVAQLSASNLSNGVSGSGAVALVNSPSLSSPFIGIASGTSLAASGSIAAGGAGLATSAFTVPNGFGYDSYTTGSALIPLIFITSANLIQIGNGTQSVLLNPGSGKSTTVTGALNIAGASGAGASTDFVCVDASSNVLFQVGICNSAAGGGNVSTSGTITTGALGVWATTTGLAGTLTPIANDCLLGNSTPAWAASSNCVLYTVAGTFSSAQTFPPADLLLQATGGQTGTTQLNSANASTTSYVATLPANTGTIPELNLVQTWTAVQSFTNGDLSLLGSSSGNSVLEAPATGGGIVTLPAGAVTLLGNALSSGFLFVGSSGGVATGVAVSGCCTISSAGVMTAFGSSASTIPNSSLANSTFDVSVPSWLTSAGATALGGTLAITATTGEVANEFVATPNGTTGAVGLRAIVAADIAGLSPSFANLTVTGSPIFTSIEATSGNTFCLQINATGGITNTGAACGSGGGGGAVNSVASSSAAIYIPTTTGSVTVGLTNALNSVATQSYSIQTSDATKTILMTYGSGALAPTLSTAATYGVGWAASVQTETETGLLTASTSSVNGIAGGTGIKLGAYQAIFIQSDGSAFEVGLGVPQPPTQTGSTSLCDNMAWGLCGSNATITWPTTGTLVVAGGNAPTGLTPVNNECVLGNSTPAWAVSANCSLLNVAQAFAAAKTFPVGDLLLAGTSTGTTALNSANTSATSYTITVPAATDTVALLAATQALTGKTYNGLTITSSTGALTIAAGKTLTDTSGIGADLLLGATGGGFAAYAGATCTNEFLSALSAAGAGTCNGITLGTTTMTGQLPAANMLALPSGDVYQGNGSNNPGAVTLPVAMGVAFTNTQGDILYNNGSTWVVLAPGTSGQYLSTGGSGANPSWVTGAGGTTFTLAPGLANSASTYNPGTQTIANGSTLYTQLLYKSETASCTVDSTCASTDDGGYLITAAAASLTFTLPSPTTIAGSRQFGYGTASGAFTYTLATGSSATIYGCGTTGSTVSGIAYPTQLISDGTNFMCLPSGSSSGSNPSFSVLTSGTNTGAAMVVGAGASFSFTTTTLPTPASGVLGIAGVASTPTLAANEGDIYLTATGGLVSIGQGSTSDHTWLNKSGTQACAIASGTTTLNCVGLSLNGIALTSAATTALGTSGAVLCLLNSSCTFSGAETFTAGITMSGLATSGTVAGSLCETSAGLVLYEASVNCVATSPVPFSAITSGTNAAGLVVGSGGSLTTSGSGSIVATGMAFSGLTGATNTTAALVVGSGASLTATGTGSIVATAVPVAGITTGTNSAAMTWTGTQNFSGSVVGNNQTFSGAANIDSTVVCGATYDFTDASNANLTVNSSFPAGCNIGVEAQSTGLATVVAGTGTVNTACTTARTRAQYSIIWVHGDATGVAVVSGDCG